MLFKCVPVRPGQHVFVMLKTVPNYCKAVQMQRYVVPGMSVCLSVYFSQFTLKCVTFAKKCTSSSFY